MAENFAEIFRGANIKTLEADEERWIPFRDATIAVLKTEAQRPVDVVHLHGRSFFDAEKKGFFGLAAQLIKEKKANYLLLADSEGEKVGGDTPRVAYPGKSLWTERLEKLGVSKEHMIYSPHPIPGEHGFHTLTESQAFLQTMEDNNWHSAIVLTQPHQILRAFLGGVRTINDRKLDVELYSKVPSLTDWERRVKGSQGAEMKERSSHIGDEVDRVYAYQAKGYIATFPELDKFLDRQLNHTF